MYRHSNIFPVNSSQLDKTTVSGRKVLHHDKPKELYVVRMPCMGQVGIHEMNNEFLHPSVTTSSHLLHFMKEDDKKYHQHSFWSINTAMLEAKRRTTRWESTQQLLIILHMEGGVDNQTTEL
uniref:Uncharacterized protein n=1 Tax=Grammatophora oceanica TaxID=210454 RepID=A0A6U5FUW3_9STRA